MADPAAVLSEAAATHVHAGWLGLALLCGPAVQWAWSAWRDWRADGRSSRMSANEQLGHVIDALQEELARARGLVEQFDAQLQRVREARWTLEDRLDELRDHAIAARAMVHELQRDAGLAETEFPPLPRPTLAAARGPPAA